ncbi:hypothetical protein [uncultured Kosakonia sp.]|nr:hypothetical protein [uncultured Kosakonia sp.]
MLRRRSIAGGSKPELKLTRFPLKGKGIANTVADTPTQAGLLARQSAQG